jgi:hypothetical protein
MGADEETTWDEAANRYLHLPYGGPESAGNMGGPGGLAAVSAGEEASGGGLPLGNDPSGAALAPAMPHRPQPDSGSPKEPAKAHTATHLTSGLSNRWVPCRIIAYHDNGQWANVCIGEDWMKGRWVPSSTLVTFTECSAWAGQLCGEEPSSRAAPESPSNAVQEPSGDMGGLGGLAAASAGEEASGGGLPLGNDLSGTAVAPAVPHRPQPNSGSPAEPEATPTNTTPDDDQLARYDELSTKAEQLVATITALDAEARHHRVPSAEASEQRRQLKERSLNARHKLAAVKARLEAMGQAVAIRAKAEAVATVSEALQMVTTVAENLGPAEYADAAIDQLAAQLRISQSQRTQWRRELGRPVHDTHGMTAEETAQKGVSVRRDAAAELATVTATLSERLNGERLPTTSEIKSLEQAKSKYWAACKWCAKTLTAERQQRSRRLQLLADLDKQRRARDVKMAIKTTRTESYECVKQAAATRKADRKANKGTRKGEKQAAKLREHSARIASHAAAEAERAIVASVHQALAVEFHSAIVHLELTDAEGNRVQAPYIADMGSGPSFVNRRHVAPHERDGASVAETFKTANGSGMDTEGTAVKQFSFVGCPEEYSHRWRVNASTSSVPILGVDFWDDYNAVFDCRTSTITLDSPDRSSRVTISMQTKRAAAGNDNHTGIHTVCRTTSHYHLKPFTALQHAEPMVIEYPPSALNRTTNFTATPTVQVVPNEAVTAEAERDNARAAPRVAPDMMVNPEFDEDSGRAVVYMPIANPSDQDLFIPKGTVYATLTEFANDRVVAEDSDYESDDDGVVDSKPYAHPAWACDRHPWRAPDPDCTQCMTSQQRLELEQWNNGVDNLDPSDPIHGKTYLEIVAMVDDGMVCQGKTFTEWQQERQADLFFGPTCTDERKLLCSKMLFAFSNIFASQDGKPGYFKGVEHRVELIDPDAVPIKCKTRRRSPDESRAIEAECDRLLDHGVVEKSNSPWAAPIVMVRKKDGGWRMCIDYRMTCNKICKNSAFPLPKIADVLDSLATASEMSLWDICWGYWNCVVRRCDRELLAFNSDTKHGLLQFKRMPFGMTTSGATMQRAMQNMLEADPQGPLWGRCVTAYCDDGCCWTTEDEEHLTTLCRVLKRIRVSGAQLKLKKCIWCTTEGKFLGHDVKCGVGVGADIEKVAALAAITELTTAAHLGSFLGSSVYLARFVKDYASLTAPLYELSALYKYSNTPIGPDSGKWTEQHQKAFEGVKAALITSPVLAFPDFQRPFILLTDCSYYQLSGCLAQLDSKGRVRPIAFNSRRLSSAEKKYGITSKEGLAGVVAFRKYRNYLLGQPCIWVTDHKALCALRSKQDLGSDRLERYAMELAEFDVEIVHRPGASQPLALPDLLSRAPFEEDPEKRHEMVRELTEQRALQILDSPAQRTLRGEDPTHVYSREELDKHMHLLIRGAEVCESSEGTTVVERVENIAADMQAGQHIPRTGVYTPDTIDSLEEPRFIRGYDTVAAMCEDDSDYSSADEGKDAVSDDDVPEDDTDYSSDEEVEDTEDCKMPTLDEIRKAQQQDPECAAWAKMQADKFVIINNMLYHRSAKSVHNATAERHALVIPKCFRKQVAKALHGIHGTGHRGVLTTVHVASVRVYWPQLTTDLWKVSRECSTCQRSGRAPNRASYGDHLRSSIPGQKWVVDLLFLEDDGPYSCVLSMRDVCTRWAIATPLRCKKSETVAKAMVEQWHKAGVHFQPEEIIHDNGSEFKRTFQAVCELINVEQKWSVAGRAESHGLIERYHRDVCQMIGKRERAMRNKLKPHMAKWTWLLPHATATINSTPSRALSSRATQPGLVTAFAPCELFHGLEPRLALDTALRGEVGLVKGSDQQIEDNLMAIRTAQKLALQWAEQARVEYEAELDQDRRYKHKKLRMLPMGSVVLKVNRESGLGRKTKVSYEERPYVVVAHGQRGNYAIQRLRDVDGPIRWAHIDDLKAMLINEYDRSAALEQLTIAEEEAAIPEYEVEAILDQRGKKKDNAREFLIKWIGYEHPTWEPEEGLNNPQMVKEFVSRKTSSSSNEAKKKAVVEARVGTRRSPRLSGAVVKQVMLEDHTGRGGPPRAACQCEPQCEGNEPGKPARGSDTCHGSHDFNCAKDYARHCKRLEATSQDSRCEAASQGSQHKTTRQEQHQHVYVRADVLKFTPEQLISEVCEAASKDTANVILLWASAPCDTFSPAVASNVGRGPGHGFNSRDFSDPERGPCCDSKTCKYAQQARLHDKFLPLLQDAVAHARCMGLDFHFVFENPRGSLRRRPYMQLQRWPEVGSVSLRTVDLCAFGLPRRKATDLWTSLPAPFVGSTGTGRCDQRCADGFWNKTTGCYCHTQPLNEYRGPQSGKARMPSDLLREVLVAAASDLTRRDNPVVIDLFAGECSLAPVAAEYGIDCISVDIRPSPLAKTART